MTKAKYADRAARIKAVQWRLEAREQARRALAAAEPIPQERIDPFYKAPRGPFKGWRGELILGVPEAAALDLTRILDRIHAIEPIAERNT